ncbi:MAG: GNAT family N-acetyltransferase [Chloroflexi bacterium]|nr:GNAT family N-acetyltransferase [Chloroflexota bacterium]
MSLDYRILHDVREYEQVVALEILVWGLTERDAVASSIIHAIVLNGGLAVGAYDGATMVGMALALPGRRGRNWLLWSHMAAVHPDYQGQGVGFALKQFQRSWALQHDYDTIGWTYDPLQRGNANFNLHRLGAIANVYHVNFYGEMTDAINAGLPSDRLEVTWKLRDRRVQALADGQTMDSPVRVPSDAVALLSGEDGCPVQATDVLALAPPACFVEIPFDLAALKRASPAAALQWRLALRDVLLSAFQQGWYAADFVVREGHCWYVLRQPEAWYLYVLECSDQSLYTGITTNLRRRVDIHNAGRGAAYTAVRRPVRLVAAWRCPNRSAALKAEAAFKRQTRESKLRLVGRRAAYHDLPFVELD